MAQIHVLYTCKECGVTKRRVPVPAREERDDLKKWMDKVGRRVATDHAGQSLLCPAKTYDLYLPAPESSRWVGEKDGPISEGTDDDPRSH